jgi:hypothetical protein
MRSLTLVHSQPTDLLQRARAEYVDQSTLRLTPSQMQRLLDATPTSTAFVLDRLVAEGFLRRTSDGYFVCAGIMGRSPKPPARILKRWWWMRARR